MAVDHDLGYYTRPDGVTIAYSHAGSGPPLVLVPGWSTHLSYFWEHPSSLLVGPLIDHVELITYDKHGCGLSDRDRTEFTMDSELYDVEALVDHLGLERFNLIGMSEGGTVAAEFAARHPERVDRLVLYSCTAYGAGLAPEGFRKSFVEIIRASWGVGSKVITDMLIPGASTEVQEEFARWQRDSASADTAAAMIEMLYSWDIRPDLGDIEAPTIIIHRRDSRAFPPENGRILAAGIPNSKAVIIDGFAHFPPEPGDPHTIDVVNAILGFVAGGARAIPVRDQGRFHAVMFTDIEGSTGLIERLGDGAARDAMRRHDERSAAAITANGGAVVKSTGDGVMATFPTASGAIEAAIALQRSLDPDSDAIRVRVGVHAGEPIAEADDLHGVAVHRAARVMSEAEGGQIFVSSIVRELVAGKDYRFTDRGLRELKGFAERTRVFEVDWRGRE